MAGRRVGTFTAGLTMVAFGILFMVQLFTTAIDYLIIFRFWPIILILLGTEILVGHFVNKEEKLKYDAGAIFLVIVIAFFAMGMAVADFAISHSDLQYSVVY